ncbi:MAG: branched-chain amino acid aminotransferase, partial [Rickettsiales bacterium]
VPYNDAELDNAKSELIKLQELSNAYVRPIAWSGSEKMTISSKGNTVNVAIACWDWPNLYEARKEEGIKLCTSNWCRPDPRSAPTQSKASCNYTISNMSRSHASSMNYDDALMLDYRGYIAETSAANIFFVKDNVLHTPIADCFLDGITRQTIIDIAKSNNIDIIERYVKPEELHSFNEVFVTGTAAEVTPIIQIDNIKYDIGPITKLLINEYQKLCLS